MKFVFFQKLRIFNIEFVQDYFCFKEEVIRTLNDIDAELDSVKLIMKQDESKNIPKLKIKKENFLFSTFNI